MLSSSWAPPVAREHVAETRFGNLKLVIPLSDRQRENAFACLARAKDIWLEIEVTALHQAQVDDEKHRRDLDLLVRKLGYKVERSNYAVTSCETIFNPASDMLGREAQLGDLRVSQSRCYADRTGWQIEITAIPWQPKKELPFTTDKLHTLVELAAQRLRSTPPTPAQNVATTDDGMTFEILTP